MAKANAKPAVSAKNLKSTVTGEAPTGSLRAPTLPFKLPEGFKAKRALTLSSLVTKLAGVTYFVKVEGPIHVSKVDTGKVDKDGNKEKPADVCHVTNLETGEEQMLLCPAVFKSTMEQEYTDAAYVGKSFAITNKGKREGKRHVDYAITELESDE